MNTQELELKKATLTAWTNILYKQGVIDCSKRSRMIAAIEKLRGTAEPVSQKQNKSEMKGIKVV